ncbi:MAG: DUF4302 domain-containing protein [Bacteroidales bacterium]|nr:DUF4302 domain-containing protein [Bacteroidales bacterium]
MKTGKLIFALLASVVLVSAQSCLKNQADIFDESSSERLQNLLEDTYAVLQGSSSGWLMEYYPGANQKYGGYAYHLMFDEQEVSVVCELDPENAYTSLYKMTDDNGAVLSFDGYNEALHFFATPSSSEYEAKGGDFEFNVVSVSADNIELRGKRSGNFYNLHRFPEGITPQAYMAKVSDMAGSMRAAVINGKVGETDVDGEIDFDHRHITFTYEDGDEEKVSVVTPFMYTDTGIRMYKPYKVAGATFTEFMYFAGNNVLTNGSYTFQGKLPDDYTSYLDFAGDYVLSAYGGRLTYNVSLVPTADSKGFMLKGLSAKLSHDFELYCAYDSAKGRLNINSQMVGSEGNVDVWFAAWSLVGGGNLTWDTSYGMVIHKDLDTDRFLLSDNGLTDMTIDSFLLWGIGPAGDSGSFTGWGDDYQFPYLQYMTRK